MESLTSFYVRSTRNAFHIPEPGFDYEKSFNIRFHLLGRIQNLTVALLATAEMIISLSLLLFVKPINILTKGRTIFKDAEPYLLETSIRCSQAVGLFWTSVVEPIVSLPVWGVAQAMGDQPVRIGPPDIGNVQQQFIHAANMARR